jgi:hypothetical protein
MHEQFGQFGLRTCIDAIICNDERGVTTTLLAIIYEKARICLVLGAHNLCKKDLKSFSL